MGIHVNPAAQMKNTSVALGEHFDRYIAEQLASGRYRTASEVIREGLRLHEERELKLQALRAELAEGLQSGVVDDLSFADLNRELDAESST